MSLFTFPKGNYLKTRSVLPRGCPSEDSLSQNQAFKQVSIFPRPISIILKRLVKLKVGEGVGERECGVSGRRDR